VVESSEKPTIYIGRCRCSAIDSAVNVLPVPGGPCKTLICETALSTTFHKAILLWTHETAAFAADDIRDDLARCVGVLRDTHEGLDQQLNHAVSRML
jgi:hypothetical protein